MAVSEMTDLRLPPQNLEAEQSVLGAVLLDNTALNKAIEVIESEDFYRSAHRKIYEAMLTLSENNEPVDQITLTEHLKSIGELEDIGGAAYVAELVHVVASAANMRYHCKIVHDKAMLRGLIRTATDVATRGYEGTSPTDELLDFAEREVFRLAQGKLGRAFVPVRDVIKESVEIVDRLFQRKERITGVATGYIALDHLLAGLQPSDLIIIAGRPSMGKTSLALGIAEYASIEGNAKVGIFSLEMSKSQLVLRMLSSQALLDSHALRTGQLTSRDWQALTNAATRLEEANIFIDDSGNLSVQQMRGKARRLKAEHGLDLLIIDYLQLMEGRRDSESRQQEISDISRSLKALAKELDIPIIALSQLSRAVENRKPPIPVLADLRESGAIEQDADVVMFIYREEVYDSDTEEKGIAQILVRKHRNGPIGEPRLQFHDRYAAFKNLEEHREVS
ncbi:MAG: replicative DNA helicase [Nitrospirales bacterium]